MNILFVSIVIPHSKSLTAGSLEVYNYIKGLSQNHDVDLVSTIVDADREKVQEMSGICRKVYAAKRSETLWDKIKQILSWMGGLCLGPLKHRPAILLANQLIRENHYDIVQVEFVEAGRYIRKTGKTKMIMDNVDVFLKPILRLYQRERNPLKKILLLLKLYHTRWFEAKTYKNFDLVLTRSEYDKRLVEKYYPGTQTAVLPHIVNMKEIEACGNVPALSHSLLFTGAFQRTLNVESAEFLFSEIFPRIKKVFPDSVLILAGGNPSDKMKKWAKNNPDVIVTGFVPDIFEYYLKSTVFVAPMFVGGGVITKIIEAMFCGCPVVTTPVGNEGIEAIEGEHIFLAESADDFCRKIEFLFQNPLFGKTLGEKARRFVEERYEFNHVISLLEQWYQDMMRVP
jgi:glycosyltransferase involved in cell wall biosynthesis